MPNPTSGTTLQRADLGAIAFEYMLEASQKGFIGDRIMPIFSVMEQSADYPVIPIEALLKLQGTKRARRGNYNRSDYEFEDGTYSCKEHGWEEQVDDKERKLYQRFFDADEVAILRAVDIILRNKEKRIADAVMDTSNITNTSNVTTEWSTAATCTPHNDVFGARQAMKAASGLTPNVLAMTEKVFWNVLKCAEVKDALKYTTPLELMDMDVARRMLATYFNVGEVLVGDAIYDSAKKGQSMSLSDIWDDEYVLLARVAPEGSLDLRDPILGRTFLWTEDSPDILTTEQYREEQTRSDIFRVRHNVDEAFVFTGAGYLLGNITA